MQKLSSFGQGKKFGLKSHLRGPSTQPFNLLIPVSKKTKSTQRQEPLWKGWEPGAQGTGSTKFRSRTSLPPCPLSPPHPHKHTQEVDNTKSYLLMLLLDVQEHEVRLNGSSKSHWPTDMTSLELSVFINDGVSLDIEFWEEVLLKINLKKFQFPLYQKIKKKSLFIVQSNCHLNGHTLGFHP